MNKAIVGFPMCIFLAVSAAFLGHVSFAQVQISSKPSAGWESWVEKTFEDFNDGSFDGSGANLYVSAGGTVQTVNRWDVNRDGYIDLIFPTTHDLNYTEPVWIYHQGEKDPISLPSLSDFRVTSADLNKDGFADLIVGNFDNNVSDHQSSFVYWGSAQGFSPQRRLELWTEGVSGIAVGDLNQDSYSDLVFANEASEKSFIYWGGPEGLSSGDRTDVPTKQAKAVAIADLNGDGFPDLIFANGSNERGGSFIYWGTSQGPDISRPTVLETKQAVGVAASDLNGDGYSDLVFANLQADESGTSNAYVYWGSPKGFSAARRDRLPVLGASGVAIGDLDGNGYPELVFPCNMSGDYLYGVREYRDRLGFGGNPKSLVYWGGDAGYSTDRRTTVPTMAATACSIGDYDGDGRLDLAFSQFRDEQQFEAQSLLFRNSSSGLDLEHPLRFKTRGASDVVMVDFNRDGKLDLAFANKISGTAAGTAPNYLYWGSKDGYSPGNRTELPASGAQEAKFADFNDDGWTDILICNQDHDERLRKTGATIFWGGPKGISSKNFTTVDVEVPLGAGVADFNKDGYLDIVFSCWLEKTDALFVYWGSPEGYSKSRRTALPHIDGRAVGIGDLNQDGNLDIVATSVLGSYVRIFWGGSDGFSRERFQELPALGPVSAEIADLNHDGFLDVVVCNLLRPHAKDFEVPSYIYWGNAAGFSTGHRTVLPTLAAHDATVVDLDKDGFLDLVFSNYRSNTSRVIPAYVYWGSLAGFDPSHRSLLPARGAAGTLIADLNHDGISDIVFANHCTDEGNHRTNSMILWGCPHGFHGMKVTWLPTLGPHNILSVDIGNRATRELQEEYVSSIRRTSSAVSEIRLFWDAEMPPGTQLLFQIRSTDDTKALSQGQWRGPEGAGSYFETSGKALKLSEKEQTYVQYRVLFQSRDGGNSPLLRKVELRFR